MATNVDTGKIVQMCLFHDLAEARTSDLNYVHQKYAKTNENLVIDEHAKQMPYGAKIKTLLEEYETRESKEAELAKDADRLELLLSLKEQEDIGNTRAISWISSAIKRVQTEEARQLAGMIIKTDSDRWWFNNKEDSWWVNRNKA
jgi:putative hydrolase of HD superfamily